MPDRWLTRGRRKLNGAAVNSDVHAPIQVAVPDDLSVLRTMLRISNAVLCANYFDEVLEVVAEQALIALGAASVSISRWERGDDVLRTLINVGKHIPGDQRWPVNETYPLADDPYVTGLVKHGRPYMNAIDDEDVDPDVADYLRWARCESEVAVPVMYGDAMWGEIWASGVGGRRFDHDDIQTLQAIAAYTAVAISRGELFTTVWRHAHQDPLTELANRRALEERFSEIDWQTSHPALLIGDLDGFKAVNDTYGHPAGDLMLRHVAVALRDAAASIEHALTARLGGDEFCVLLPRATLADAQRLAQQANRAIAAAVGAAVTMAWGAAEFGPMVRSGHELMAAADAAMLHAKALGPGRFIGGITDWRAVPGILDRRPGAASRHPDALVSRVVGLLDANRPLSVLAALEILAVEAKNAVDAAGWAVSVTTADGRSVVTHRDGDSVRDPVSGRWVLSAPRPVETYRLADYPASARAIASGSSFIAAVDVSESDPAETALLDRLGYCAVLAVGVRDVDTGYLVEIFCGDGHTRLAEVDAATRVLAHYCVRVAHLPPTEVHPRDGQCAGEPGSLSTN